MQTLFGFGGTDNARILILEPYAFRFGSLSIRFDAEFDIF